ncbi:tetratricopeptide repeat protein 29-like [Babylonia areolata]|uniref:tetratricopeptide repeat protein 29-like n=1 Tax=Babylonia areolata TaxID=304850 RepID=UPI003FD39E16
MAVALPPINNGNGAKKVPTYADNGPRGPPSGRLKPLRVGNKKERELEEQRNQLRALQKDLNKAETAKFRNSYKHTLCLDMLKDGFHLSFKELFNLIQQQLQEREAAGPESLMWTQTMLQDKHEELETLKHYLTIAETAQRKGDYISVYLARYDLACYFQPTKDKWLADHFFKTCLDTASHIDSDGGQTKAEAHCNLGIVFEENGDYFGSAEHFEAYYDVCKANLSTWVNDVVEKGKVSPFTDACVHLYRIYTSIGDKLEREDEREKMLEFFTKAFDMTKQAKDKKLEGNAAYRLGLAYEDSGDVETALVHLNNFYEASKIAGRTDCMGKACDAIAKAYAKIGQKERSIEYLKEFVETAQSCGMDAELSQACHNLGNVLNSLGNYKEAGEYFNRAYNISRAMNNNEAIQVNRVQSGIAQAHAMMNLFSHVVAEGAQSRDYLERTIDWKSIRANIQESREERMRKSMQSEPPPKEETSTVQEPVTETAEVEAPEETGQEPAQEDADQPKE